ncbi:apolipoprotein N-acyltransferase [Mycolicibacterium cyprinidarum]|uniref:Apolipoprotein N-acyltransferase n=1 Tax=Mycolicibacterium cyprinidarum TaxID=2860311 RepID=A0ABQ4VFN5_9MYCO|nr:apolipoprotein N-acyltransferase [Mycolicibacterium sp. NGTWS1803]GJF12876.1 apolipoprotein N-acyltransferase [Mycolicibacterium sp. NGTWS0302]GJF14028.1 apolipoprotein N-acyltransferase [Mycolicibacterium sp. NGTWSNA01]
MDATTGSERVGGRRMLAGLTLSLLSAFLLVVIWQSFGNLWWLTFVAFVPMYVAQYRVLPRRWSAVPVALAFAGYYLALGLLTASVLSLGVIIGAALGFGVIGLAIGVFLRPFAERTGYRWFVVQFPLIWVTLDLLIQNNEFLGTNSWIGYRLGGVPQLVQPVSITSTPALNLLLLVINSTIALMIFALMDRRWPGLTDVPVPRPVLRWSVAIPVAVTTIWTACSLYIFSDVSTRMGPSVRVAAVQPGLDNATPGTLIVAGNTSPGRSEAQRIQDQIEQLSDMTRQAAGQGAEVVVWPEETLNYDPRVDHTEWIPALVRETDVYLVMGFTPDAADGAAPNTALLWSPEGEVVSLYLKTKRVLAEGEAFTPGTVYPTVETPVGVLGMIICFDIDFPDGPARREVLNGAQLILAPSIDIASIADVRSASTVFRAVENRVAMVKADVAWDSVLVAPNGRVIASTAVHAERGGWALLVADVPLGPLNAPFTRYGNTPFQWLTYAATLVMIGCMVTSWRRRSR